MNKKDFIGKTVVKNDTAEKFTFDDVHTGGGDVIIFLKDKDNHSKVLDYFDFQKNYTIQ